MLFVAPPYRVELSQNAFIIIACSAFLALYALIRAGVRLAKLPEEVREGRRRRQFERFRSKQDAAVVALLEGRHGKARQFAQEALAIPHSSPVAALVGARAALETRDYAAAAAMLDRPDTHATNLAVPRLMLEAEIALERGQPAEALARLAELRREAGLHTAAQRLELRALTAAGTPRRNSGARRPARQAQGLRRRSRASCCARARTRKRSRASRTMRRACARIGRACRRTTGCSRRWRAPPRRASCNSAATARRRTSSRKSLERNWDSSLALLYAECRAPDATRQLETAERWLVAHNQDASLLYALGRLCERQQLWGKAQTYLEASLALDNHWRAHVALGEMLAKLDRHDEANAHLAAALKLALAELARTREHRGRSR